MQRSRQRDRVEIIIQVLSNTQEPMRVTRLMYAVNTSHGYFYSVLSEMEAKGLVTIEAGKLVNNGSAKRCAFRTVTRTEKGSLLYREVRPFLSMLFG